MELKTEKGRFLHIYTMAQGVTERPEDTGLLAPWPHSCILCLAISWALIIEAGGGGGSTKGRACVYPTRQRMVAGVGRGDVSVCHFSCVFLPLVMFPR